MRDQEGDICTGDDPNAKYTLDEKLECKFATCAPGFEINENGTCVFIAEEEAKAELELAREELEVKKSALQQENLMNDEVKAQAVADLAAAEARQEDAVLALEEEMVRRLRAEAEAAAERNARPATTREKRLIDKWLDYRGLNRYGDPPDTVYPGGSPLFNESTGTRKDRYAYIKSRHRKSPWMNNLVSPFTGRRREFPKHWGPEPENQTKDYMELPGGYGFGSSTLAKWITKNMDADARARALALEGPREWRKREVTNPVEGDEPLDWLLKMADERGVVLGSDDFGSIER